jgi:phosphatidylserine/phosphatidylglycerophosphate/cardiolipin synthase-like enzyme
MKQFTRNILLLLLLGIFASFVGAHVSLTAVESVAAPAPQTSLAYYFSPHGGAKEAILKEIGGAREEILVAMYNFTSSDLAQALVRAKGRGVRVRVILDEGQQIHEGSGAQGRQSAYLAEDGIDVSFDSVSGLMHNKFAVIDRSVVLTGSYNWTDGAEDRNFENLLVIRSDEIASRYADEFDVIRSYCGNPRAASE